MRDLVPTWLLRSTLTCACLLVLGLAAWLVAHALMTVVTVTAAGVAALLLTALLQPLADLLRRGRLPGWLAALVSVLATLAVVVGLVVLLVRRVQDQQTDLRDAVVQAVDRARDYLRDSPLPISPARLEVGADQVTGAILEVLPSPAAGASLATEVLSGVALTVFLWFFLLKDGARMWSWFLTWAPERHQIAVARGGAASWEVLTGYIRGTTVIAAADALGVGLAMLVLGVPLTASLASLVFLGAFVPIVGAFVSGSLAVGVTLVTLGPVQALVLLGCVLLVQQLEGSLLQPLVMGRALHLHPVAVVLAVALGALVGGVLGALVAVPVMAIGYRLALQSREGGG